MKKKSKINQTTLKNILSYDSNSGDFIWLKRNADSRSIKIFNAKFAGKKAGCICPRGYKYIHIREFGILSCSRLAWLYFYGYWPKNEIDHINGNPSDNRISNLREATRSQNASNRGIHKNNKSGYKGVTFSNGKWTSCVAFNKKRFRLGIFETAEEAYKAYLIKSKEVQKEFSKYE